jgi:hypothetical protein
VRFVFTMKLATRLKRTSKRAISKSGEQGAATWIRCAHSAQNKKRWAVRSLLWQVICAVELLFAQRPLLFCRRESIVDRFLGH